MMGKELYWRCENGHVLGRVVERGLEVVEKGRVVAVVDERSRVEVRCGVCGAVRVWYPGRRRKVVCDE